MADVILFRRSPFLASKIERVKTRNKSVDHPDGAWSTESQPPPGFGWEIENYYERWTIWRRAV
jgi:hypothetical protein